MQGSSGSGSGGQGLMREICRILSEVYGREEMRYGTVQHGEIRYDPGTGSVRASFLLRFVWGVCKRTERDFCCVAASSGGHRLQVLLCSRFSSRGEAAARPRFGAAAKVTRH